MPPFTFFSCTHLDRPRGLGISDGHPGQDSSAERLRRYSCRQGWHPATAKRCATTSIHRCLRFIYSMRRVYLIAFCFTLLAPFTTPPWLCSFPSPFPLFGFCNSRDISSSRGSKSGRCCGRGKKNEIRRAGEVYAEAHTEPVRASTLHLMHVFWGISSRGLAYIVSSVKQVIAFVCG